jgi:ATP/maltotriose-dependent transcriptional regulator MalT
MTSGFADRRTNRGDETVNPCKLFEFAINGETFAVVKLESTSRHTHGAELARFEIHGGLYGVVSETAQPEAAAPCAAQILTGRELQIATLVAEGLVNKEIADRLSISEWTVCTHVRRIYTKLGVSTRGAMVSRTTGLSGLQSNRAMGRGQPRTRT